jgi:hypothetical protein
MIAGFHTDLFLAVAYAVFLVAVAAILEAIARFSHRRASRYPHVGFVYRHKFDLFDCPAGQQLIRSEIDYRRRVITYRAPARACNSCSLKNNCTDSDEGRLLQTRMDSWLESELRRFHRGISITLLFLAVIILAVETARNLDSHERLFAAVLLFPVAVVTLRLLALQLNSRPDRSIFRTFS